MFELIGTKNDVGQKKVGGPFLDHYTEIVIAIFDTIKDAELYIKKSMLKKEKRVSYSYTRRFSEKSLLSGCEFAEVRECIPVPHNPVL